MEGGDEQRAASPVEEYQETLKRLERLSELHTNGDARGDDSALENMVREVTGNHTKQMRDIRRTLMKWNCQQIAKEDNIANAWYRMFVLLTDWAMSIPEFRSLPPPDQTVLFRRNFVTIGWFHYAYRCYSNEHSDLGIPIGNGYYIPYHLKDQAKMDAKSKSTYGALGRDVISHVVSGMIKTKVDEKECCLMMAHALFLFDDDMSPRRPKVNLSPEGAKIAKQLQEKNVDAFNAYQKECFPMQTDKLRSKRAFEVAELYPELVIISKYEELILSEIPFWDA